jgi:hypothetical protein
VIFLRATSFAAGHHEHTASPARVIVLVAAAVIALNLAVAIGAAVSWIRQRQTADAARPAGRGDRDRRTVGALGAAVAATARLGLPLTHTPTAAIIAGTLPVTVCVWPPIRSLP